MLELRCDHLHSDRLVRSYAAELDVIGDLTVVVDGVLVVAVPDFPPIELAAQLSLWLRDGIASRVPFESTTAEAEEVGIVRFLPDEGTRSWRIGSVWGEAEPVAVNEDELVHAIDNFIRTLSQSLESEFSLDAGRWLPPSL